MRKPGIRLLRWAERNCSPEVMESLVLPLVGDLQYEDATAGGRPLLRRFVRARSYFGVGKALSLHLLIHRSFRMTTSSPRNDQLLPTFRRIGPLNMVALATTACLVLTVVFIQWKIMPTYAAMLALGGFWMPLPASLAGTVLARTPIYGLLFLLGWALYRRVGRVHTPVTLARVLVVVNVFAVVVLIGQTSGFVAFAVHGPKLLHRVAAAQEQSPTRYAAPSTPRH